MQLLQRGSEDQQAAPPLSAPGALCNPGSRSTRCPEVLRVEFRMSLICSPPVERQAEEQHVWDAGDAAVGLVGTPPAWGAGSAPSVSQSRAGAVPASLTQTMNWVMLPIPLPAQSSPHARTHRKRIARGMHGAQHPQCSGSCTQMNPETQRNSALP